MAPAPDNGEHRGSPSGEDDGIRNIPHPQIIMNDVMTDSDDSDDGNEEDAEFDEYSGYEMLPQEIEDSDVGLHEGQGEPCGGANGEMLTNNNCDFENGFAASVDSVDSVDTNVLDQVVLQQDTNENRVPSYMKIPPLPQSDPKELLWNQAQASERLNIDHGHAEKVKLVMSKIQLPMKNIPDWAKNISDEQWKEKLSQLNSRKTKNS